LLTLTPNFEEEGGGGEQQQNQQQKQQLQASAEVYRLHQVADYQPGNCFKVSQFLAKNNMTVIPIPHTHLIWPRDFFLFRKLKLRIKGRRFNTH